jgi:predicted RNA binding protein YcfA (HicA-like mRNA interferase family)
LNRKEVIKRLEKNAGYTFIRDEGHSIYGREGCRPVPVPHKRDIDDLLAEKIFKEAGLDKYGNQKTK